MAEQWGWLGMCQTCVLCFAVVGIVLFHIILVASPWVCQLKVVWFIVVFIPVICYSCSSWLEDHCNPVVKNMKYYTKKHWWTQPFSQSCEGYWIPSVGVHYVVCGQLCFSSTRKAISVECKMTIIHQSAQVWCLQWGLDVDMDANFSSMCICGQ